MHFCGRDARIAINCQRDHARRRSVSPQLAVAVQSDATWMPVPGPCFNFPPCCQPKQHLRHCKHCIPHQAALNHQARIFSSFGRAQLDISLSPRRVSTSRSSLLFYTPLAVLRLQLTKSFSTNPTGRLRFRPHVRTLSAFYAAIFCLIEEFESIMC